MIKIILYFIVVSIIYNLFKNIRIGSSYKKQSKRNEKQKNFNNNDNILDAEYEEL